MKKNKEEKTEEQVIYEKHLEICAKNKKEMTPEEYKDWMDSFD